MDAKIGKSNESIAKEIGAHSYAVHDLDARIMKRVLEGVDQTDRAISHAVKEFLVFHENGLRREENREVLKTIESSEALNALVRVHRATISLLAGEFRHRLAQKHFEIASTDLGLKIREFEGVDEDWDLNLHREVIVKRNRHEEEPAFRKIFEFVKSMAEETSEVSLHSIREGRLPEGIDHSANLVGDSIKLFLRGLATFLLETKAEGHKMVLSISEDPEIAKVVAFDQNAIGLLRFWAAFTLKHIHNTAEF